ncbi:DegT/DnrJ/EryC1/StrS aminotransferase family protein [Altererythrobacter sp. FM1]|uniref:DegT/DnrJ/EryC1/StrS family aminotransferase n=1 Tax=Tsuneonella flava TaxID=2055955 RepID=UPI000C800046|nr:DegT/DnrJ/EryC1/StrS aminotransferase family protein [Tsuneonella flava]ROT96769.1 DegT/DnrJ/EryC1/StrS aminotransferase family protein [Altererythrobacter sp. FM1]
MLNANVSPWPSFTSEEISAVVSVLQSNRVNYWTGSEGRSFESEFAAWVGVDHAIALTNGTVALDLALHGLGIGAANGGSSDDEVIVTPRTFIASVSSVINAGAKPVFADVVSHSGNISVETIAAVTTERTRGIVVVHLAGWPADMDPIMEFAECKNIKVIEDCAQAHGARYKGRSVGSIGHVGAWSFCQDKIMTTGGEGGMVTTNDRECWSRMWSFKDHGKSWDAVYNRQHPPGFRWLHETIGTNWRMIEMQAAIGRVQLRHMAETTERRNAIASRLYSVLAAYPKIVQTPLPADDIVHAYYRLYAYVHPTGLKNGWTRDRIVAEVVQRGAPLFQGTCSEVYLEKAFDNTPFRPASRLPRARELGETSLMFLTHPTLTDAELDRICNVITSVLDEAGA